jgi:hypothetical protein
MTALDELPDPLRLLRAAGLEVLAAVAAPDVEVVADHRKPHWMGAEQQLAVFDGVKTDVGGELPGAASVPAGPVAEFRGIERWQRHFACWGT